MLLFELSHVTFDCRPLATLIKWSPRPKQVFSSACSASCYCVQYFVNDVTVGVHKICDDSYTENFVFVTKMAKVEAPGFILPKKRNGKKGSAVFRHVDHIITVQGATESMKEKPVSPYEHVVNGVIHNTMEGVQSDVVTHHIPHDADLSPIYEDSLDGSSHDDLPDTGLCRVLTSDCNESSSATPNSISHTQSENSFEMGSLTDASKNSIKKKKKVNIVTESYEIDNDVTEITALRTDSKDSVSDDQTVSRDGLTITGTIKRGKKKGQNVDVKLNISREELEMIERSIMVEEYNKMDLGRCSLYNGIHVLILSVVCFPAVMCASSVYSFMVGTKTWYNILNHVIEENDCFRKVLLAPLLILLYPFLITGCSLGLGLYAAIAQLSLSGGNWWKEVQDLEKGFYSWLCDKLQLSQCSPYEVIILSDIKS